MSLVQNVDVDVLEEFRNFLKENPDKGKLKLEARAVYEGQVGRSTVHIGPFDIDKQHIDRETRHYTIPFGAWKEIEESMGVAGASDRVEPVEMTLAATAACVVNSITLNAVRLGLDIQELEISVRSTIDPRVLFGVLPPEMHPSCIGQIDYDVKVRGNLSDEDLKTIQKLCEHSPVYGMLNSAIPMKANIIKC